MLQVQAISCERGERELFSDISFTLQAGAALQIIGGNGAGKTSLLQVLCLLRAPTQGTIYWQGTSITQQATNFLAQLHFIGHQAGINPGLTVRENLCVAAALAQCAVPVSWHSVAAQVGLSDLLEQRAAHLSCGQQRRLALSRLVLVPAALWILDEPFMGLDTAAVQWLEILLQQHLDHGGIVLFTSHQAVSTAVMPQLCQLLLPCAN